MEVGMQIQVNYGDITHSEAVDEFVTKEVQEALEHVQERVTRVEVHLRNLNGPKAGVDKRCTMEVRLSGQPPLVVEHDADDLYESVHLAAGKLERAVRHRLERLAERR
jgi:ribosomal subunit interface protein